MGSGSRAGSAYEKNKYGSINRYRGYFHSILVSKKLSPLLTCLLLRNLSALFPAGMPPVEKLHNPLASSRLTLHAYEDVSIPRTEL